MKPRRILHVMGTADLGGTAMAHIVENLAAAADPERYELAACFLRDGELVDRLQKVGVGSTCVRWNGSPIDVPGATRYAALLRSSDFSIIHQHTGGRWLSQMGRSLTNARIVHHLHGRASELTGIIPAKRNLPACDALIAVSQIVAEFSQDPRAVVIHPGINISRFPLVPRKHKGVVIGTACRLEMIKGLRYLIEAMSALVLEFSDLRLEIAGDGSLRSSLEQEGRRLGLSDHISFLGWQQDIASLMASWDVFVLPSLDEGFPLAALEAMAAGLPVVASAVGGLGEMVVDGETGFLVPAADPAALAASMHSLLHDPKKRNAMGEAGRQRVSRYFSATQMAEKTFRLYDDLLD